MRPHVNMRGGISALVWLAMIVGVVESLDGPVGDMSAAESIHSLMPRLYGPRLNPSTLITATSDFSYVSYGIGTAALSLFGLGLFAISLIGGVAFCVYRYICCRCCCDSPDGVKMGNNANGSMATNNIRFMCSVVFSIFSVVSIGTASVYVTNLSDHLSVRQPHRLLFDGESVMVNTVSAITIANSTLFALPYSQIDPLLSYLNDNVADIQGISTSLNQVTLDLFGLQSQLDQHLVVPSTAPSDINNGSGGSNRTWSCLTCGPIDLQISDTVSTIQTYATGIDPTINALQSVIDNLQQGRADLLSFVHDISDQLQVVKDDITQAEGSIENQRQKVVDQYEPLLKYSVVGMIAVPVVVLWAMIIGRVGKPGKWNWCFGCSACLGWMCFAGFSLLFAIFLPMTSLLSDGCVVMDFAETNLATLAGSSIDGAARACLGNSSLAVSDAFNLTGRIQALQAQYGSGDDMTTHINALSLDTVATSFAATQTLVSGLSAQKSFGFNDSQIDDNIRSLNFVVAQYLNPPVIYSRQNLQTFNDSTPGASVSQHQQALTYKYSALQLMDSETAIDRHLLEISARLNHTQREFDALALAVANSQNSLNSVPSLVSSLFSSLVDAITNIFWCGWLGQDYVNLKNDVCHSIALDVGIVSLTLVITLALLAPIIVLSIRLRNQTFAPISCALCPISTPTSISTPAYDEFGNISALLPPSVPIPSHA